MNGIIESFIPGRIRLRSPLIKDAPSCEVILAAFKAFPGVRSAEPNVRTGSLLLKYDPSVLTAERLMPLVPQLNRLAEIERDSPSPERVEALKQLLADASRLLLG